MGKIPAFMVDFDKLAKTLGGVMRLNDGAVWDEASCAWNPLKNAEVVIGQYRDAFFFFDDPDGRCVALHVFGGTAKTRKVIQTAWDGLLEE